VAAFQIYETQVKDNPSLTDTFYNRLKLECIYLHSLQFLREEGKAKHSDAFTHSSL